MSRTYKRYLSARSPSSQKQPVGYFVTEFRSFIFFFTRKKIESKIRSKIEIFNVSTHFPHFTSNSRFGKTFLLKCKDRVKKVATATVHANTIFVRNPVLYTAECPRDCKLEDSSTEVCHWKRTSLIGNTALYAAGGGLSNFTPDTSSIEAEQAVLWQQWSQVIQETTVDRRSTLQRSQMDAVESVLPSPQITKILRIIKKAFLNWRGMVLCSTRLQCLICKSF